MGTDFISAQCESLYRAIYVRVSLICSLCFSEGRAKLSMCGLQTQHSRGEAVKNCDNSEKKDILRHYLTLN